MAEARKHEKYDALIHACHALAPLRTAVVHPCDDSSLAAALDAAAAGLIEPVLVGPRSRIAALAATLHRDLNGLQIVDTPHSHASAEGRCSSCAPARPMR